MGEPEQPIDFSAKAISVLSSDSPLFDAFWPVIFDVADTETQKMLGVTSTFFRGMAKRAEARRISAQVKRMYLHRLERRSGSAEKLRLDPHSDFPLWYEWGADKCGFESCAQFEEFCRLADVSPAEGMGPFGTEIPEWLSHWTFVSSMGDITFSSQNDPRDSPRHEGYVHYFGCTGEREKALRLEAWFMENCEWEEVCHGYRDYI